MEETSDIHDCIIVGQGIAGTALAETFLKNNKKIIVLDDDTQASSSKVAAGIFNPLTGKNLVKTWQADLLFPFLKDFYQCLEKKLATNFLHFLPIYRPFRSVMEQNDWLAKSAVPEWQSYIAKQSHDEDYQTLVQNPFGGIETLQAGWVDVGKLLKTFRCFLESKSIFFNEKVVYREIKFSENMVSYKYWKAKKMIFCEGVAGMGNPYFAELPFSPVKGEIIDIYIKNTNLRGIVNQGVSIVPIGQQGVHRVASTYSWKPLDWDCTEQAKKELTEKARDLLRTEFEVVAQRAGIRPATKHRRPIMGLHKIHPALGIFNGLGSKGISLAPYWANHFYQHLEYQTSLHTQLIQIE